MNLDFTPDDIISGTVNYSFEDFLRSLYEQTLLEVAEIITLNDPEWRRVINGWYKLTAEVCYASAGKYTLEDICKAQQRAGSNLDAHDLDKVLKSIKKNNQNNIKIMEAIAIRERLSARKMGINEENARELMKAEVSNIINQVLEEEGMTCPISNCIN